MFDHEDVNENLRCVMLKLEIITRISTFSSFSSLRFEKVENFETITVEEINKLRRQALTTWPLDR
jgi:hypothetical protein